MNRSPQLNLINRTIAGLAGGTTADGLTVRISRRGHRGPSLGWEGSTRDLAQHVHTALAGDDQQHPAPAYTPCPGDLVHLHYPDALNGQGWGETYLVAASHDGLRTAGLQLLFQPATRDGSGLNAPTGYDGRYEFNGPADPLARPLAELGRDLITVVRNGAVVPLTEAG